MNQNVMTEEGILKQRSNSYGKKQYKRNLELIVYKRRIKNRIEMMRRKE